MNMKDAPRTNCRVCLYWVGSIQNHRAFVASGVNESKDKLKQAQKDLDDHIARVHNIQS